MWDWDKKSRNWPEHCNSTNASYRIIGGGKSKTNKNLLVIFFVDIVISQKLNLFSSFKV